MHVKVCVRLPGSSLFRRAICLDNNDSWKVCHKSCFVEVGNQNSQTFRKFASAVPSSFHQKLVTFYAASSRAQKQMEKSVLYVLHEKPPISRKAQTQQHKNFAFVVARHSSTRTTVGIETQPSANTTEHRVFLWLPFFSFPNDPNTTPQT